MAGPDAFDWEGQAVLGRGGEKIGTIREIFLVEETGRPEWALIKTGRLKGHTTLVPLTRAHPSDKGVELDIDKSVIEEAPAVPADAEPDEQQVNALYRHYGIEIPDGSSDASKGSEHGNGHGTNGAQPPATAVASGNGGSSPAEPATQSSEPSHGHGDLRDAPIADVAKQAASQAQTLLGQEARLAKAEMTEKAKDVGIGAGMFGGAGFVAYLASLGLMLTLIFALAEVMPEWTAALIVTVVLGVIAAVLALQAKKKIKQAGPPIPEQTVQSVKQTIETVKEEATWGLGQTR